MPAKNWWQVNIECRDTGAIGEFNWKRFIVRSDDKQEARKWGLDDAHLYGYETRGVTIEGPMFQVEAMA